MPFFLAHPAVYCRETQTSCPRMTYVAPVAALPQPVLGYGTHLLRLAHTALRLRQEGGWLLFGGGKAGREDYAGRGQPKFKPCLTCRT